MDADVEAWVGWMRAAGRPETTIGLRTYHVRRALQRELGHLDPWGLSVEDLVCWLGGQSWKPETRRAYRASLRAFFWWAQATGRRADNPGALIPVVTVPRGLPRPAPENVVVAALGVADEETRLMIRLAAVCGLRRGEIARVRVEDLEPDLLGMSLRVHGKGGHVRQVPVPDDVAASIRRRGSGWVFPSPRRPGEHLTPHHVGVMVSRVLPEGWTCHTLRHRCATVAYRSTRDLRAVQELLGHAKPETTARYTQVPQDAVRAAVVAATMGDWSAA